ncbi:Solute carrier family 22 member 8 [Halotydeus destructor]|nr:Solute carrier family 22 member 8 [Halotydeus destructor]
MLSPLDYVLLHLGNPGRYQLFVAFLIFCLQLPISFTNNLWKYYADEPPHRCLIPFEFANGTTESEWIPVVTRGKVQTFSQCTQFTDSHNQWKGTQSCQHGWQYKPYHEEHNVIIEYDLVCERKYLANGLYYGTFVAAMFGGLVFGTIADHFERKRSLLVSLYLFIAAAFSLHFAQDFLSFAVCYAFQACFIMGVHVTSYVLLIEVFPTPYQLQASLYLVAFSTFSSMLLPLLMWLIKNWRYVQLAVSAPGVVFLAHVWLLPQSPLWLVVEGKIHATENLMEKLAQQNGKTLPPSFRLHVQKMYNSVKSSSYELRHRIVPKFSSPALRWYLLVHFYLFFVVGLTMEVTESHMLHLNSTKYADHFYRGLIDLGSIILIYYFAVRLGPRTVQAILFILAGLLMMSSITLQEMMPKPSDDVSATFDYRLLLLPSILVSGAKTLMKTLPAFIYYHSVKSLPTGVRVVGFACCMCWNFMGQMAAPNLLVLAELIAPFIPIGLCGSLSVIGGGLSLLFPSCWRKPLPNTVDEVENKVLIPVKDRYPSFTELKSRKPDIARLRTGSVQSNIYSIPGTTIVKRDSGQAVGGAQNSTMAVVYNLNKSTTEKPAMDDQDGLDSSSSVLDDDDIEHHNWQLYSYQVNGNEARDRDLHVFTSAQNTTQNGADGQRYANGQTRVHRVAETNL